MLDEREERIRAEAYRRWEKEGRPHGEHDRHWREAATALTNGEASDIIETEGATQALKAPKARVAKPKAPKEAAKPVEAAAEVPKRTRAKKAAAE